jgi:hypothetical protein
MSSYLDLLVKQDQAARTAYSFDPRVAMQTARRFASVEPFTGGATPSNATDVQYSDIPSGSHSDPSIVQTSPNTTLVKRYVVIDTSQRDWVKQPNPFSNLIFTFGNQSSVSSNPPIYYNNPFIPTNAVEQQRLTTPIPGLPNTQGWSLAGTPSNTQFPAYNSSLPPGNFIGYDLGYNIAPAGSGFGSVFTPCNVAAIRLVRAVMPQRQFLDLPVVPLVYSADGGLISATVQRDLPNTSFSTFSTYPYLMLYLNEYYGQYVGGNEPTRRSFSVMTQKQRQQQTFTSNGLGVQQFDYEGWSEEALKLQSPITNLQRLQISVTDPVGNIFIHNDTLSIALMQATSDGCFIKCFTSHYQYFSGNEIRVGDRVVFYPQTLSNMLKSPILATQSADKSKFINALAGGTFAVLQLLDYIPNANGVYEDRGSNVRTLPYVSSYNGFVIANFFSLTGSEGNILPTYPNSIDATTYTILEPNSLVGSNLEFMNASLQPVYTLELDIKQPDTGTLGGKIVV